MISVELREIRISDKIHYVEGSDDPLSADIGIIRDGETVWLFDVGSDPRVLPAWENCCVVLSHFHQDHTGNLERMTAGELYVSNETRRHVHGGTLVDRDLYIGKLHIFPLPSSHCKGCLGLEVDETYAFVGDGLYSRAQDGRFVYNAQQLKAEIQVLKALKAPFLLVSHRKGLIYPKAEAIAELEALYALREKNSEWIQVRL